MNNDTHFLPKNLILLDPSLVDAGGHHLSAAANLAQECQDLGIQFRAFCNTAAQEEILDLPARPLFNVHAYILNTIENADDEYSAVISANNVMLHDLCTINQGSLSQTDFIFFPVVTYSNVIAICQWIASFPPEQSPKFGLGFLFQLNWNTDGRIGRSKEYAFQMGSNFISDAQKKNIVCTCETEALAADYNRATSMTQIVIPIPTLSASTLENSHTLHRARESHSTGTALTVGFIGVAKPEKGIELLPAVIAKVLDKNSDVRVIVHMNPIGHPSLDELYAMATNEDRLTVTSDTLPIEDYERLLQSCDLNVLAYDPENYAKRGSAIFNESNIFEIPVVVPEHSWMGDFVKKRGTGICFSEFTPESITNAILAAITSYEDVRAAAINVSKGYAHRPYLKELLETL